MSMEWYLNWYLGSDEAEPETLPPTLDNGTFHGSRRQETPEAATSKSTPLFGSWLATHWQEPIMQQLALPYRQQAWNRGRNTGQKAPFKRQEVWAIRFRLQLASRKRDLALFNLAIDSKLRGCDLVSLKVRDICNGDEVLPRAKVVQRKTGKPVQFEITVQTRSTVGAWIANAQLSQEDYLFPTGVDRVSHLSTRQYARLVNLWAAQIGLDPSNYGTHSLRRTKASLIYRKSKNLRAVQLLLGHTKLESTVRYLGVEVEDALMLSEQTEV
jgi:integrase